MIQLILALQKRGGTPIAKKNGMKHSHRSGRISAGFTILELLVVVAIMAVMTAVAIPQISRYFRNYKIRNAVQAVGGEITSARNKAIMKNVNWGVVFLIENDGIGRPNRYQYLIEDDQTPPRASTPMLPGAIIPPGSDPLKQAQLGPLRELPEGIVFGTACSGFVPTDKGFRFNRMGAWCDPGTAPCSAFAPPAPAPTANLVMNTAGIGARICLVQADSGLRREVRVSPGGRVLQEDRQR
jgi:prepilin-type N-terminal cleavage/methylation domain-containing protein